MEKLYKTCIFAEGDTFACCSILKNTYCGKDGKCNFYKSKDEYESYIETKSGVPVKAVRKRGN